MQVVEVHSIQGCLKEGAHSGAQALLFDNTGRQNAVCARNSMSSTSSCVLYACVS
jgi:hypothetical protein